MIIDNNGDIMEQEQLEARPLTFKEQWEAQKLLKKAKKKAKHSLQKQGFGRREASMKVNKAVSNLPQKPMKKSAGRGR